MPRVSKPARRRTHKINPRTLAAAVAAPKLQEALAEIANPVAFAKMITDADNIDDPVSVSFTHLRDTFLAEHEEHTRLYLVLSELDNFGMIEESIRTAGFVMGFMVAARLLTGKGFESPQSRAAKDMINRAKKAEAEAQTLLDRVRARGAR